jgi:hypothetical protein
LLQQLLDLQRATSATVSGINAKVALHHQIVLRLVAKSDLLADLTLEERGLLERTGAAAMEMARLSDQAESTQLLLDLIRSRIRETESQPGLRSCSITASLILSRD